MQESRRRSLMSLNGSVDSTPTAEPFVALIFHPTEGEDLEYSSISTTDITPPLEWKDLYGTIEICEGVESIASDAFQYFKADTYILPSTLLYVGPRAFMRSSVSFIDFYDASNCVIGGSAFAYCQNLTLIYIPSATITLNQAKGVQAGTFGSCTNLTSVTWGANDINISDYAFDSCLNLILLTISATNIGRNAFNDCASLSNIRIQLYSTYGGTFYNYPTIGADAFASCDNLLTVEISGAYNIEAQAFILCPNLNTVKIDLTCQTIGIAAFSSTPLSDLYLGQWRGAGVQTGPNGEQINTSNYRGTSTSFDCTNLRNVYLGENITIYSVGALQSICGGSSIFKYSNQSTKNIYAIRYLGKQNWTYEKLVEFNIPLSTEIMQSYLANYDGLRVVVFPASLTSITTGAFEGCSSLYYIICFATTPPTINEEYAFGQNLELVIKVPESSVEDYKLAAGWSDYSDKIGPISPIGIEMSQTSLPNNTTNYVEGEEITFMVNVYNTHKYDILLELILTCSTGTIESSTVNLASLQWDDASPIAMLTHTVTADDITNGSYTFRGTVTGVLRNLNVSKAFEATITF